MTPDLFPATRVAGIIIFALLVLLAIRVSFSTPRRRRKPASIVSPTLPVSTETELN